MQFLQGRGLAFVKIETKQTQFNAALTLRAQEHPELQAWMERKNDRYLSHDM